MRVSLPLPLPSNPTVRNGSKKSAKHRQSLYSIEFSPPVDNIRGRSDELLDYDDDANDPRHGGPHLSPKPMTPRRVKRRSVMTRGTTNRQSTTSRRSQSAGPSTSSGANGRNSQRASRRKYHQNPVTKLMDQQLASGGHRYPTFQRSENPSLTENNLKYLNKEAPAEPAGPSKLYGHQSANNLNTFHQPHHPADPDPIYYNMESNTALMQQHAQQIHHQQEHLGHYNPTYLHSNPNLTNIPAEPIDDLYSHRPPSVRSSYSNFHGARHLTSYTGDNENVFVGLGSQAHAYAQHQQQQQQHHPPPPPLPPQPSNANSNHHQHHHNHNLNLPPPPPPLASVVATSGASSSQALPIPYRKQSASSRDSSGGRSMAFLNNGPPAYNLNYHTPPDSETTM